MVLSGAHGAKLADAKGFNGQDSTALTVLDLATQEVRYVWLPISDGHIPIHLTDGRTMCCGQYHERTVVLDKNLNITHTLTAPEGYLYTGHPLTDAPRNRVYVPLKAKAQKGTEAEGLIEVFNLKTLEKEGHYPSGATAPHELRFLPGNTQMAVCHYGDIITDTIPGQEKQLDKTHLTLMDLDTMAVAKTIPTHLNAMLTHMDVGDDGHVYAVLSQFLMYPQITDVEANIKLADNRLHEAMGIKRDWPLSRAMVDDWRYDFPMPILRINPQTADIQSIFINPGFHLRCQSVAAHHPSHLVFVTGHYSNTLMAYNTQTGKTAAINGDTYDIADMRGVCTLEGTPYIALSGLEHSIAIIDTTTLKRVRYYSLPVYQATHIVHIPA